MNGIEEERNRYMEDCAYEDGKVHGYQIGYEKALEHLKTFSKNELLEYSTAEDLLGHVHNALKLGFERRNPDWYKYHVAMRNISDEIHSKLSPGRHRWHRKTPLVRWIRD